MRVGGGHEFDHFIGDATCTMCFIVEQGAEHFVKSVAAKDIGKEDGSHGRPTDWASRSDHVVIHNSLGIKYFIIRYAV